mmetsp:Transcript_9354/g.39721  ORF Transcript_9354/g.39721 Transcript_9354/m.39721 type:complete len:223 (+) Transcript_9354:30-698(+)
MPRTTNRLLESTSLFSEETVENVRRVSSRDGPLERLHLAPQRLPHLLASRALRDAQRPRPVRVEPKRGAFVRLAHRRRRRVIARRKADSRQRARQIESSNLPRDARRGGFALGGFSRVLQSRSLCLYLRGAFAFATRGVAFQTLRLASRLATSLARRGVVGGGGEPFARRFPLRRRRRLGPHVLERLALERLARRRGSRLGRGPFQRQSDLRHLEILVGVGD